MVASDQRTTCACFQNVCQGLAVANDTLPNMGLFIFNKNIGRGGGNRWLKGIGNSIYRCAVQDC